MNIENKIKVSVIVPIYNVEKYLKECVDSIINQTLKDIEILLINDGSKDNCAQIIDEYAKKDERIIAIHKENGGYGNTCNLGFQKARGEYISIIEPDDFIEKNMFEDLYNLTKEEDVDIIKSSYIENYDAPDYKHMQIINWNKKHSLPTSVFNIKECPLFFSFHPSIWTCLYKKSFLDSNNIKFLEIPGAGWSDNLFQIQTMCLAQKILYTKKSYYFWRIKVKNQSEDIRDISMPFKRMDEINLWLKENSIEDREIINCINKRNLSYIEMILTKKDIKETDIDFEKIKNITKEFNLKDLKNSKFIDEKTFQKMFELKNNPEKFYSKIKKKDFIKNLFSIKWNKQEKKIVLFGKIWSIQ